MDAIPLLPAAALACFILGLAYLLARDAYYRAAVAGLVERLRAAEKVVPDAPRLPLAPRQPGAAALAKAPRPVAPLRVASRKGAFDAEPTAVYRADQRVPFDRSARAVEERDDEQTWIEPFSPLALRAAR